jgi:hypothetical protein
MTSQFPLNLSNEAQNRWNPRSFGGGSNFGVSICSCGAPNPIPLLLWWPLTMFPSCVCGQLFCVSVVPLLQCRRCLWSVPRLPVGFDKSGVPRLLFLRIGRNQYLMSRRLTKNSVSRYLDRTHVKSSSEAAGSLRHNATHCATIIDYAIMIDWVAFHPAVSGT